MGDARYYLSHGHGRGSERGGQPAKVYGTFATQKDNQQEGSQNSEFQTPAKQALEMNFKFMSSASKRNFLPKAVLNQGIDTPHDLASHQHRLGAVNLS